MRKVGGTIGVSFLLLLGAAFARAADLQAVVNAWDMQPGNSQITWDDDGLGYRYCTGGAIGRFWAGVPVPQGAIVHHIALQACDSTDGGQVSVGLYRMDDNDSLLLAQAGTGVGPTPGCTSVVEALGTPETIDQSAHRYVLLVSTTTDALTAIGAVRVVYSPQVSPAPIQATFNDVPTGDPGFQYIEALFASGITAGCGSGNYCPDAPLTRRQMAVFFSKALGLYWPAGF